MQTSNAYCEAVSQENRNIVNENHVSIHIMFKNNQQILKVILLIKMHLFQSNFFIAQCM